MSRYGYFTYGNAAYGLTPTLAYSVEPMSLTVLNFSEAYLTWQAPTGNFTRLRVVRNQNAFPETPEDGVIIYEQNSTDGSTLADVAMATSFYDGLENPDQLPLSEGRNIFYRVFLYTADEVWLKAGQVHDVIPNNTGATEKIVNLLPRVLTTPELSPLGVVDETSDLYQFLDGLGFLYEQLLTEIKLARPSHSIDISNYNTIPGETLNVGLLPEPNLPELRQRALIREAISLYATKGTKQGVENYAEALTGFAPTATVSENLLLSVQDSTFYKNTGAWVSLVDTIESVTTMTPSTLSTDYVIDNMYTCKITGTGSNYMELGHYDTVGQGIPVTAETDYKFYCEVKCASTGGMTVTVEYFDAHGGSLGTDTGSISATSSWQAFTVLTTSPANAVYAGLRLSWNSAVVYYVDRVMFSLDTATAYEEARAVTIELAPQRENYIYNPSFELDAAVWTYTGATFTRDSDVPLSGYAGAYSGKFVNASAWTLQNSASMPLEPGTYFAISQYMKSPAITSVTGVIKLYDADDILLDTITETYEVTTAWTRPYMRVLIPSDSTATYCTYQMDVPAGTLYVDMVMAQDAYSPTDYFDGSMPLTTGALWKGTAHNSVSMMYPNKGLKLARLADTLVNWLPMNVWWRITTPAGVEYTTTIV